jgi:tetratricopeptide (TPR) repeat protein
LICLVKWQRCAMVPGKVLRTVQCASNSVRTIIVESPDRFARDLAVQLAGHDFLKNLGVSLIPATAPDFLLICQSIQSQVQPGDTLAIAALKGESDEAIKAGRLAEAETILAQVDAEQLKQESLLRENWAQTAQTRAELAMQRIRYVDAAKFYADAAILLPDDESHREKRLNLLVNQAKALYREGNEFGDNSALRSAIELNKRLIDLQPRERAPLDWATTQNNLGSALRTLGGRESGTARLEEAVAAYREALMERTRERVPLDWAQTQQNLGVALSTLGGRESGTARLEEAVAAYREALMERTRERVPLDWALTQNNLGSALRTLGGRESGTARLEEAVAAYREALKERTRERVPLDWATSTGTQGVALRLLAERQGDLATAEQALAQITEAFETCRDAHDALNAAFYEAQLPAARALIERLRKG